MIFYCIAIVPSVCIVVCDLWRYYWCYFWRCVNALILLYFCTSACSLKCYEYICFSTFRTYTPRYVFITLLFHALGLGQCFQACPSKSQYTEEVFHDSNLGQQFPKLEIEPSRDGHGRPFLSLCSSMFFSIVESVRPFLWIYFQYKMRMSIIRTLQIPNFGNFPSKIRAS